MDKKASIKTTVYEDTPDNTSRYIHDFRDNGVLLGLLKDLKYEKTNDSEPFSSREALIYNAYDKNDKDPSWSYYLYDSGDYVRIFYHYKNHFGEAQNVEFNYHIDATKGKEIITKALELAKK